MLSSLRFRVATLTILFALAASVLIAQAPAARAASVASTAQANAQALMDSGRLTFGSSSTRSQVQSYADGAEYVNPSTGRACNINDVLLDSLKKVIVDQGFSIRIISLNRWCEGSEPTAWWQYHIVNGGGHAVDIIRVNGVASTGATTQDVAFVRAMANVLPTPAGVGQRNCGQVLTLPSGWTRFDDGCDHLHIEYRGADVPVPAPATSGSTTAVYRFWSPVYQGHFYTASAGERDQIMARWPNIWTYEGIAYSGFTSPVSWSVPLYRFWSAKLNGHFYTADRGERDSVMARWPDVWSYEGVAYYVYPNTSTQPDAVSVHRFWSQSAGHHFYTSSEDEKNQVIARWPDVWGYEGVNFKVPGFVSAMRAPSARISPVPDAVEPEPAETVAPAPNASTPAPQPTTDPVPPQTPTPTPTAAPSTSPSPTSSATGSATVPPVER